jgi:Response regulator containing CheY-like receiver, AAA-type ATPase, and DNA-binding domains
MARILLAEDNERQARIMMQWLRGAGHEVTHVASGVEGVLMGSLGEMPDLIISDLMMPQIGGEELVSALEGMGLAVPVMVVTACTDGKRLQAVRESPAILRILAKPITCDQLRGAVEEILG